MAELLADEDVSYRLNDELRALGHTVIPVRTVSGSKRGSGKSDNWVFDYAQARKMIVVTGNEDDFVKIHAENPGHYGIITVPVTRDMKRLAKRIDAEIKARRQRLNGEFLPIRLARKKRR
jgi:hypothetical protein